MAFETAAFGAGGLALAMGDDTTFSAAEIFASDDGIWRYPGTYLPTRNAPMATSPIPRMRGRLTGTFGVANSP
jgi:hypothetical protein